MTQIEKPSGKVPHFIDSRKLEVAQKPDVLPPIGSRVFQCIHDFVSLVDKREIPGRAETINRITQDGYWAGGTSITTERELLQYLRDIRFFNLEGMNSAIRLLENNPRLVKNAINLIEASDIHQAFDINYVMGRFNPMEDNMQTLSQTRGDYRKIDMKVIDEYKWMFKGLMIDENFQSFAVLLDAYRAVNALRNIENIPPNRKSQLRTTLQNLANPKIQGGTGELRTLLSSPLISQSAFIALNLEHVILVEEEKLRNLQMLQKNHPADAIDLYEDLIQKHRKRIHEYQDRLKKAQQTTSRHVDELFKSWGITDPELKKRMKYRNQPSVSSKESTQKLLGDFTKVRVREQEDQQAIESLRKKLSLLAADYTDFTSDEFVFPEAQLCEDLETVPAQKMNETEIKKSIDILRESLNGLTNNVIARVQEIGEAQPQIINLKRKPPLYEVRLEDVEGRSILIHYHLSANGLGMAEDIVIERSYRSLNNRIMNHAKTEYRIGDTEIALTQDTERIDNTHSTNSISIQLDPDNKDLSSVEVTNNRKMQGERKKARVWKALKNQTSKTFTIIPYNAEVKQQDQDIPRIIGIFTQYTDLLPQV